MIVCVRCQEACDLDDNFCRHCGLSLLERPPLPSVRSAARLPVIRPPSVPATVAKGAAFVAAGKIAELLVRRMARNVLGGGRSPRKAELIAKQAATPQSSEIVSETVLVRQIRIRR
ncbi:MAG: zinc ribbon domain-containing protein [Chloroflexi bacterium]|nr:zinc ribbon domain-containing protein [Chloroflexota bacterium]